MTPDKEPVALAGAGQALVIAVIAVLDLFHLWSISQAQQGGILALYAALVTFLAAWARSRAYSPATVLRLLTGRDRDGTVSASRSIPPLPPERKAA